AEKIPPAQRELIESMYRNAGLKLDDAGGALGGIETEPTIRTPHVLSDGADSMGLLMASARVYVNEGMMWQTWVHTMAINPFDLKDSMARNFAQRPEQSVDADREAHAEHGNLPWHPRLLPAEGRTGGAARRQDAQG